MGGGERGKHKRKLNIRGFRLPTVLTRRFAPRPHPSQLEPVRGTAHKWTRFDGFPHRCLETVYIHTLLRDGYGFDGDGRDVEFVLEIGGEEVEWTMGMALESRVKSMK